MQLHEFVRSWLFVTVPKSFSRFHVFFQKHRFLGDKKTLYIFKLLPMGKSLKGCHMFSDSFRFIFVDLCVLCVCVYIYVFPFAIHVHKPLVF